MKSRISLESGGQSKTWLIGRSFFGSTPSSPPSQTTPITCRGPSGTCTTEPGSTAMPSGTE
ncbi:hypothetical protein ACVMIX_004774 [Rhizobium leguminosarum]